MENDRAKLAWCLIVKADDREAELLDRLLGCEVLPKERNINFKKVFPLAKFVDKLFITITGENKKCEEVARKYGAVVSHYKWDMNFANARNFNFSQVTNEYDYIGWCDADDLIENANMLPDIVQTMKKEAVDAVVMQYLYDFDSEGQCIVEHLKTRIVKNDGTAVWVGAVHEDFAPERQWLAVENKDIKMLHITEDKRIEVGKKRNTEIAAMQMATLRDDPRSYWNLANAYMTEGREADALPVYLDFLERSQSEEERFLAWLRIAAIFENMGDLDRAIATGLEALSLRPWYPDAYFQLGRYYSKANKLNHAKEMLEMGFTKKIPDRNIIVWNPRDYDFNPGMLLGQVYLQLERPRDAVREFKKCLKVYPKSKNIKNLLKSISPLVKKFDLAQEIYEKAKGVNDKEELKKILDSVPEELQYYPAIVNLRNVHFVKKESSGKDLAIFCGYTVHEWDPEVAETTGVGGSEEAVIQLAKRWKDVGYNVTVYANIGHKEKTFDGVKYVPFMAWNYRDKQDIVIIWRHPKSLDYEINAPTILVDMHDVIPKKEFTRERIAKVTKVMFKSVVHRDYYPQIPLEKTVVIPHGLDIKQFDELREKIQKNPYHILNTSSPDRGLRTCMRIIKRTYEKLPAELKPKLKFSQYYGFNIWDSEFANDEKLMKWKSDAIKEMDELKEMGIMTKDSGVKIAQSEVAKKYLEAGMLLYPSNFFEIGFISGIKAMLAGCVPLTTDVFAQGEFIKDGIKIHSDVTPENWVVTIPDDLDYGVKNVEEVADRIVDYMQHVNEWDEKRENIIQHARQFDWDKTALSWIKIFNDSSTKN